MTKKITLRTLNAMLKKKGLDHNTEATKKGKDYFLLHICKNGNPAPLFISQNPKDVLDYIKVIVDRDPSKAKEKKLVLHNKLGKVEIVYNESTMELISVTGL
jgi:hypothetical protein